MISILKKLFWWLLVPWPEYILILLAWIFHPQFGMITSELITLTLLLVCQNAAFTMVSRARQSKSLLLHGLAAMCSNGFYIFVLTAIVAHYDNWWLKIWYIVCTVVGSVHAHHISLHKVEESKRFKKDSLVSHTDLKNAMEELEQRLTDKNGNKTTLEPIPVIV